MPTYRSVQGTHDILPENAPAWRLVEETVRSHLQHEEPYEVIYHLKFVRNLGREKFSAQLWPLLDHNSKQVRDLVMPLLAGVPEAEAEALSRLKAKKAFKRAE